MKFALSRFLERRGMKSRLLLTSIGMLLAAPAVMGQTSASFVNQGNIIYVGPGVVGNTVEYPPQINATNFINNGLMELIAYPLPFQTASTLNFTNYGEMLGEIGWEFDYGTSIGTTSGRGAAATFYNGPYNPNANPIAGLIESYSGGLPNPSTSPFSFPEGYLWVSATNLINKGMLASDAYGETRLIATNMDLSRSYVWVYPVSSIGSSNGRTNFISDTAIYDESWWQTNVTAFDSTGLWNGLYAISQPYDYWDACGINYLGFQVGFPPTYSDSYVTQYGYARVISTNIINETPPYTNVQPADIVLMTNVFPTNVIHQAAFVYVSDPNIYAQIGFTPSTTRGNYYQTVLITLYDLLSGESESLQDTLASSATRGLLPNSTTYPAAQCNGVTYRPANYIVQRNLGLIGSSGLGPPTNNFLYDTNWLLQVTNAIYSDYSWFLDNQASEPPTQPGSPLNNASSVTNLTGRIHIYADNLNLYDTQIRGEGEVVIKARNLVSSQKASVDCQNLSYDLGATNGFLNVVNLAPPAVLRFHGSNTVWSAVWSNLNTVLTPSYIFSNVLSSNTVITVTNTTTVTNSTTITNLVAFYAPETNLVIIGLSDTMLDASKLQTSTPVWVYNLELHSTNMVISDHVSVIQSFLLDGPSFTLNGSLTFPGTAPTDPLSGTPFSGAPIQDWVYTMAPTLQYFTNNGSLSIPNDAHFGDDGPTNYHAFINNGLIIANDQTINSDDLEINRGVNESLASDFSAAAATAVFSNAEVAAAGNLNLDVNNLRIDSYSILSSINAINFKVANSLSDGGTGSGNQFQCQNGFNLWVKPATGDLLGSTFTTMAYGMQEVDHAWAGEDRGPYADGFTNNVALNDLVLSPQYYTAPHYPLFYFYGTGVSNGLYVSTLDLSQLGTSITDVTNMIGTGSNLKIYYVHLLLGFTPPNSQTPEQYMDGKLGGHLRWVKHFDAFAAAAVSASPKPKVAASFLGPKDRFNLTVTGTPGQTYAIQASTDLVNWVPIYTNAMPVNGRFQFMDTSSSGYRSRFYRVVTGP